MNIYANASLIKVRKTYGGEKAQPRMVFSGRWLYGIGFAPGATVHALPVPGGIDFRLLDENTVIPSGRPYKARGMGGAHVRVCLLTSGRDGAAPAIPASGRYICAGGLAIGDTLIARYGYGLIRARKISPEILGVQNLKAVVTAHIKSRSSNAIVPQVLLSGHWLTGIGFGPGAVAAAYSSRGVLTFSLVGPGTGLGEIIESARGHSLRTVQGIMGPGGHLGPRPLVVATGTIVERAGFLPGDMLAASYGYGEIKLQRLDFEKLGF